MFKRLILILVALGMLWGSTVCNAEDDNGAPKRIKKKAAKRAVPKEEISQVSGGGIRITCDRDAVVYVDSVAKGSCPGPVDVRVTTGEHKVRIVTATDTDEYFSDFEKQIVVGDGAVTRVEANEFKKWSTYKGYWKRCKDNGYDRLKSCIQDSMNTTAKDDKQYLEEAKLYFDDESWNKNHIYGVYGALEYLKDVPYGKHVAEANQFIDSFKNPDFEVRSNSIVDKKTGMRWYKEAHKYIGGDTWYKVNAWALDDTYRLPSHDELLMLSNYCFANGWGIQEGKKCYDYLNKVLNFIEVQPKDYWTTTMDDKGEFVTIDFKDGKTYFKQSKGFGLITYRNNANNGSLLPKYKVVTK
jgi:hypothetical protein